MTKAELKQLVAQLDFLNVPETAEIKLQRNIDNGRMGIHPTAFKIEGQDAEYSLDAQGHWSPAVSQANTVILKEV